MHSSGRADWQSAIQQTRLSALRVSAAIRVSEIHGSTVMATRNGAAWVILETKSMWLTSSSGRGLR